MKLFSVVGRVSYAPEVFGNREAPKDQRCIVELEPLSAAELRQAEEEVGKVTKGAGEFNYLAKVNEIRAAVLERSIKSIKGLALQVIEGDEERLEEVKTVELLLEHAPDALLDDIYGAIKDQSKLSKETLGN